MKALIFANGIFKKIPKHEPFFGEADLIVAADGGANHCYRLNITPDILLGDLDSVEPEVLIDCKEKGVEIQRYPTRKDATDLELALDLVLTKGTRSVLLLGALGGRWDMSLANITLAARKKYSSMHISFADHDYCIHILHGGKPFTIRGVAGQTVSFLPINGDVCGLNLTGFEYPLQNHTIPFGSTKGISNILITNTGQVSFAIGVLICSLIPCEKQGPP